MSCNSNGAGRIALRLWVLLWVLLSVGCSKDLNPSDSDIRPTVVEGSKGGSEGQQAADFTALDTAGNRVQLSTQLSSHDAVVFYFTMWCPLCDSHMTSIRSRVEPTFPGVRYLLVDYVSGTISQSLSAQLANGYASETVLVDIDHALLNQFDATMGTTIVIDAQGKIRMNEDYKQSRLISVLENL